MEKLLYLLLLLVLGKLSSKIPAFPVNTAQVLNQFVIWVAFPATVFLKIADVRLGADLLVLILVPWLLVGLSLMIIPVVSKYMGWDRSLTGGLLLTCALGNTAFCGLPLVAAFLGEDHLAYAIIYDQFGSFLALAVFGTVTVCVFTGNEPLKAKSIIMKIITFPPFIALVAGLLTRSWERPEMIKDLLTGISATLVPLAIFSVGNQLRFRQSRHNIIPIGFALAFKMIFSPGIILGVLLLTGISGPVFHVAVFQAAMPTMVMAGVLASAAGLKPEVANAAVGYGILAAFITLPIFYWLIVGS